MRITTLGTSSGIPTRHRNVSATALQPESGKDWYLIDCGEGTQHRVLQSRLSIGSLQAIFITHLHGDHCFGLFGLLASMQMMNRQKPLTIVAPEPLRNMLETVFQTSQTHLDIEIDYVLADTEGVLFEDRHFSVSSIELSHRVPCWAYQFKEKPLKRQLNVAALEREGVPKGPLWQRLHQGETVTLDDGRVFKGEDYWALPDPPRKVIVAGDNDQPELLLPAMRESHLMLHEATYSEPMLQEVEAKSGEYSVQHSSALRVAKAAAQAKLPNLILTHFSARYQFSSKAPHSIEELRREARSVYSGRLAMAEDMNTWRLTRDGHCLPLHDAALQASSETD